MRRVAPLIAVGLGAFLLVAALAVRFYAYPRLAVAPLDQSSTTTLVANDATIFDQRPEVLHEIQTDLTTTAITRGDVPAAQAHGDGVAVWVNVTTTTSSDGVERSAEIDRAAFDAHTGEAVNCCDEYMETEAGVKEPVEHKGLLFKLPFETEKKTYDWWDETLRTTVPISYKATEKIEGMTVYRFEGEVARQEVSEREVPASIMNIDGIDEGNVTAQEMYQNYRTFWVEPHTGVIIKRLEEQKTTLAYEDVDRVIASDVATQFTDETVQDNIDTYGTKAKLLGLVLGPVPWIIDLVGLLLLAGGVLLQRRSAATTSEHTREPVSV